MENKYNLKSVIAGLILIILGGGSVVLDIFCLRTNKNIWISIGCSLLASGIVILLQALLVDKVEKSSLDEWGLIKIYKTRADKNADSDKNLSKAKYQLDAVAFGLKSFRNLQSKNVTALLKKGVNIRILTMNPDPNNPFLKQREIEENESEGQILKSIQDLVKWADNLNNTKYKGTITIKGYKCMTLDFYWRVDDELYIGPYWYGIGSQQTITYKFKSGKAGFKKYSNYFEDLWNEDTNNVLLTTKKGNKNGRKSI